MDFTHNLWTWRQVMMAHERCGEEDAEAILSNLKMEGRSSVQIRSSLSLIAQHLNE
jgi:hypothetical protein